MPGDPKDEPHTCHAPMFSGIIPGCKRCEEIAKNFGFEPYSWHTMRQAQIELDNLDEQEGEPSE